MRKHNNKNVVNNTVVKSENGNSQITPIVKYAIDDFFNKTVKIDFEALQKKVSLATTSRVEELHLIHSVYGHACEGHSEFYEMSGGKRIPVQYKNITLDDIVSRIPKQNPDRVKRDRQEVINQISEWLYDRIETLHNPGRVPLQEDIRLIKAYGEKGSITKIEPLAGASMFEYAILKNFESVLVGFYLGSCMDSYEWREKVDKKFGSQMHKGTSVPVDLFALRRNDLTLDDLQHSNYLNKLSGLANLGPTQIVNKFVDMGVIPKKCAVDNNTKYASAFLELSKGYGISDDAAFITASLLFGTEAGFGLLLADAIDTLDKYTPSIVFGGQDELIGRSMKAKYESRLSKKFPVSDDQILKFIYLSSITKEDCANFPSCSQRRFWQKDEYGMTAVQSHMSFLNFLKSDSQYPPLTKIGFKGVLNSNFYSAYVKRLEDAVSKNILVDKYSLMNKKYALHTDSDRVFSVE